MINKIEIKAPAKINIGLYITEKRADGFHNIETIFYPVKDLFDKIILEKNDKFEFICSDPSLPADDSNLAVKAVRLLEEKAKKTIPVKINLEKKIPYGAGLGGGSSDAAAVLISVNDMYNLGFNYPQLLEFGLELGSDVPFFVKTFPSVGKSRGEKLTPLDLQLEKFIVIVNPGIHISTKEAYSNVTPSPVEISWNQINEKLNNNPAGLKDVLKNDFEDYAFKTYPEIKKIKEDMYAAGAEYALMTGSGSTLFAIFNDKETAEKYLATTDDKFVTFLSDPEDQY